MNLICQRPASSSAPPLNSFKISYQSQLSKCSCPPPPIFDLLTPPLPPWLDDEQLLDDVVEQSNALFLFWNNFNANVSTSLVDNSNAGNSNTPANDAGNAVPSGNKDSLLSEHALIIVFVVIGIFVLSAGAIIFVWFLRRKRFPKATKVQSRSSSHRSQSTTSTLDRSTKWTYRSMSRPPRNGSIPIDSDYHSSFSPALNEEHSQNNASYPSNYFILSDRGGSTMLPPLSDWSNDDREHIYEEIPNIFNDLQQPQHRSRTVSPYRVTNLVINDDNNDTNRSYHNTNDNCFECRKKRAELLSSSTRLPEEEIGLNNRNSPRENLHKLSSAAGGGGHSRTAAVPINHSNVPKQRHSLIINPSTPPPVNNKPSPPPPKMVSSFIDNRNLM